MNLLELFEADITDIPPSMRRPLTMRDIEDLKPQGPFPYVVVHKDGFKERFMDLNAAKAQARAEGGKVYKIQAATGQLQDVPESVKKKLSETPEQLRQGLANFYIIAKYANDDRPIEITLDGKPVKVIDKYTKRAIVKEYQKQLAKDAEQRRTAPSRPSDLFGQDEERKTYGRFQEQFLKAMSTEAGYKRILAPWQALIDKHKEFSQKGGSIPGERGYQEKLPQDYNFGESLDLSVNEDDIDSDSARTQKILRQIRMSQPQARSDAEAIAYAFVDAQKKDQEAIDRLEKDLDDVENDVQTDLKQQIAALKKRRDRVAIKGADRTKTDDRQDALIKRLDQINTMQDKAIDDLESELSNLEKKAGLS